MDAAARSDVRDDDRATAGKVCRDLRTFPALRHGGPATMDEDGLPRPRSPCEDDGPVPGDGRVSQSSLRNNDDNGPIPGAYSVSMRSFRLDGNDRPAAGEDAFPGPPGMNDSKRSSSSKDGGFLRPHAPCDNKSSAAGDVVHDVPALCVQIKRRARERIRPLRGKGLVGHVRVPEERPTGDRGPETHVGDGR